MILDSKVEKKRLTEPSGFICGYARDPDKPSFDDNIFLMFNVLPENALLDRNFKAQYGDVFVKKYVKNIDYIPYNVYVFKRNMNVINEVLAIGDIKGDMPLEDDWSMYLPDDYSLTVKKIKDLCN